VTISKKFRVIPESAQRLSGTHRHRFLRMGSRVWVPALRFAAAGMTPKMDVSGVTP
jgi:hypothetical protein